MWRIIISFVVALSISATLAVPTRSITSQRDRSLRIGGSSSVTTASDTPSNGFSLSFVPLFSLLANFIPRILSRFNGVNAYKARSLGNPSANFQAYINHDGKLCSSTRLGPWPDASNCRQFYVCQLNSNCSTASSGNEVFSQPHGEQDLGNYVHVDTILTNCTIVKVFQCQSGFVYNSSTQICEEEDSSLLVCEQE